MTSSLRRAATRVATRAAALLALLPLSIAAQAGAAPQALDTTTVVRIDSVLDLDTVIQRALVVNPGVVQAEQAVRMARSAERVSTGAYLPSLSVNSNALRSNVMGVQGIGLPGSGDAYSAGLSSSVELFTGGRRAADRSRARADEAAATAADHSQRYGVALVAERAFYEVLRGGELVSVARARVVRADRGLRYAQDRVRAGTATRSDELRARLELTSGRQQLLAARDTLQSAAFSLGRLVGADGPIGAQRPGSLEPSALALGDSAIVQLATTTSPAVQTATAVERATSAVTRAAKSQYVPDLRLTGGYNWATQSVVLGAVRPGWQVAVGTSFPLFNGFQREDAVTRADAAATVARASLLDVTRQVRSDASRLLSAIHFAEQNVSLAGEGVRAAQEDIRVQTERYRAGISTALDQLSSQLALTQAELGLVAARFNYQIARASLEALVGRKL
jgi:outer membrane protein